MANSILIDQARKDCERFINSLDLDQICRLASSYHGGLPCQVVRVMRYNPFNVGVIVMFPTIPPESWVVRLPIPGLVVWIDEKLEAELATMRYVGAKTTIPIPRVHGYSFTEGSPIQMAFIIMDCIAGRNLADLDFPFPMQNKTCSSEIQDILTSKLYRQLADFYIQLRQLEFPEVGALGLPIVDGRPVYECDPDDIHVRHRPMSMEMSLQEIQGFEAGDKVPPRTTFSTASSFVNEALLRLADNEFDKCSDVGLDTRRGQQYLYARHHFRNFVIDTWLDPGTENGPFVLMHGELDVTLDNLLFDNDLNLVGVKDWEWSCVVPIQIFVPPVWLVGGPPEWMIGHTTPFNREAGRLVAAIRERETALQVPPQLSNEWDETESWCHTAIVMALRHPDLTYDVFWHFLFGECVVPIPAYYEYRYTEFYRSVILPLLTEFIAPPGRKALLARKMMEQRFFYDAEKDYFKYEEARRVRRE
ncbi:hypothetical protein BGZ61DRAFT_345627 [Ilyonectria robusta]|uniref:uncharacterized protein n=1 Tax=Ilyonectria robusta TaxID=1079257 RepID=UPI001E8EA8DE|nr:uncharacterized protein BGZ61DRAFT_345627 [Ilyonectria robusta]KAH8729238.1 hypothetical protein BGZ61DRAFT_345627 [Ilyonectria robusta]